MGVNNLRCAVINYRHACKDGYESVRAVCGESPAPDGDNDFVVDVRLATSLGEPGRQRIRCGGRLRVARKDNIARDADGKRPRVCARNLATSLCP